MHSRTVGALLGESRVANALKAIQDRYPDMDIGSSPFHRADGYGTNLVMRGMDEAQLDKALLEVRAMIINFGAEPIEELAG